MPSQEDSKPVAVTAERAARQLGKATSTVRYWVTHYNARRLGKVGRRMFYDLTDLAIIEREIRHEHPVPMTWQERAVISRRCPLRAAERLADAA